MVRPHPVPEGSRQSTGDKVSLEDIKLCSTIDSSVAGTGGDDGRVRRSSDSSAIGAASDRAEPTAALKREVQSMQESLRVAHDRLQTREQELREMRDFHAKQARETKAELARAIEAQSARVRSLEEQLRRTRKKFKTLAQPKPTRAHGRVGQQAAPGAGGSSHAVTSTPLSTDELLNLLAAADEEVFEAKGRAQRLEHELRTKSAEADALRAAAGAVSATRTGVDKAKQSDSVAGNHSVGASDFAAVACAARLASAEAEVQRLRDEVLVASEAAMGAQREASALRLEARRTSMARADEGRSREKELRRQVSAYKREADRLRSAVGAPDFPGSAKERKSCRSGEAEDADGVLVKTQAQLGTAREESERRGRTIIALRAAKNTHGEEVGRQRQEAAQVEEKLKRALKNVSIKSSAVKTLRDKISNLEVELETARKEKNAAHDRNLADASPGGGDVNGAELTRTDAQAIAMRELKAERDRLRDSMRTRQGLVSKLTAEIDARVAEVERLQEEASGLRAAVARKDDAFRATKKKVRCGCCKQFTVVITDGALRVEAGFLKG